MSRKNEVITEPPEPRTGKTKKDQKKTDSEQMAKYCRYRVERFAKMLEQYYSASPNGSKGSTDGKKKKNPKIEFEDEHTGEVIVLKKNVLKDELDEIKVLPMRIVRLSHPPKSSRAKNVRLADEDDESYNKRQLINIANNLRNTGFLKPEKIKDDLFELLKTFEISDDLKEELWCLKNGIANPTVIRSLFGLQVAAAQLRQYATCNLDQKPKNYQQKFYGCNPAMYSALKKYKSELVIKKTGVKVDLKMLTTQHETVIAKVFLEPLEDQNGEAADKAKSKEEREKWIERVMKRLEKAGPPYTDKYDIYVEALPKDASPILVAYANLTRDKAIIDQYKEKNKPKKETEKKKKVNKKKKAEDEEDAGENGDEDENGGEDEDAAGSGEEEEENSTSGEDEDEDD